jgi:SAM-dependent methyltransferase
MSDGSSFRIQVEQTSVANRYPEVFFPLGKLSEAVHRTPPRVLSFGCSVGFEPHDLATRYFTQSAVFGLDVSETALAKARAERSLGGRITYDVSTPANLGHYGPFDVITAMSVLCRWPDLADAKDASELFPFAKFEETVRTLDGNLAEGGILVVYNSNYDFKDTAVARNYDIVLTPHMTTNGFVKRFRKGGAEMPRQTASDAIFRKRPAVECDPDNPTMRFIDTAGRFLGAVYCASPA